MKQKYKILKTLEKNKHVNIIYMFQSGFIDNKLKKSVNKSYNIIFKLLNK